MLSIGSIARRIDLTIAFAMVRMAPVACLLKSTMLCVCSLRPPRVQHSHADPFQGRACHLIPTHPCITSLAQLCAPVVVTALAGLFTQLFGPTLQQHLRC